MPHTKQVISALFVAGSALIASVICQPASAGAAAALLVSVENITQEQGTLMIAIFRGEDAYKNNVPVSAASEKIEGDTVTASFTLEPGEYGIKLYQDVNDDGKLNTGAFGIPTEPYGFSNNAPVRFGPPGWAAAMFEVSAETATTQTITLK